ncbi:PepSY-associated TM helix domain-containing protein [Nodularia harveyana UHCC-0300]|uniref:PepSY-associated TM helix domain-containing protein n=1 Tax=Nodularia harveyana UHCC-0300 TaxID=2974287 RepID=A0ABU5UEV7_9CYAN|nr:PepSY-associated TM helix domain-containing protein [Nodularia harveyana]MEA5582032.1 PepSY-associated TM helix domain-containing protein [Nodularia harveyana UHCC-0300]
MVNTNQPRQFRKLHRQVAPLLFIPLLLSALSGIGYRLGRSWFGMSKETANIFMAIHQGSYLGKPLVPIYVLLVGLGLVGLVITGLTMIRKSRKSRSGGGQSQLNFRRIHSVIAPIIFLPLLVSAITGISYSLGERWLGLPEEQIELLMTIHQGSYFGSVGKPIYVFLIGLGLIAMLFTGLSMTGIFRKRHSPAANEQQQ